MFCSLEFMYKVTVLIGATIGPSSFAKFPATAFGEADEVVVQLWKGILTISARRLGR